MKQVRMRALLGALLVLGLIVAPGRAGAATNHPFLPAPSAEFHLPAGSLEATCGLAIDSHSSVYVSEYYRHTIDVFGPGGGLPALQILKEDPLDGPCGLAVDPAGNLYVNNYHRNVVRYTAAEISPPEGRQTVVVGPGTVIDSGHSTGVAVDPASGEVYVDDRTYIAAYGPSGAPLLDGEGQPLRIAQGSLTDGYGIAVSDFPASAGYLYVADAADHTVKAYDPAIDAEQPVMSFDGAGSPQGGFTDLADASLAVEQSSGHLFVLDNIQPGFEHPAAVVDELNDKGDYRGQLPHAMIHGEPSGLALDPASGEAYVTSGNWETAGLLVFGPAGAAQRLAVARTGGGEGTIISSPAGINCPSACAAEYDLGTTVTLSAVPAAGSAFGGWSVAGSPGACPGTGACQVTLSADLEVKATFEAPPAPLLGPAPPSAPPPASALSAASATSAPSTAQAAPAKHKRRRRRHHPKAKAGQP